MAVGRALLACWFAGVLLLASLAIAAPKSVPPVLTRPPRLLQFVTAPWPDAQKAAGHGATVVLAVEIDANGLVSKTQVQTSAGADFDQAAQQAVQQFHFEPALWDGKPGPVRIVYRYVFEWKELPRPATLAGKVRDGLTGKPVANLPVRVVDVPDAVTQTRADGTFELRELPAGTHPVEVGAPPYQLVRIEETLAAGMRLQVRYTVMKPGQKEQKDDDDYEVVVHIVPLRRETVAATVEAGQAARVPGGQGDVLKVVESMPGVARAAAGSGDVVVWGSTPGESRTFVDGVPVPKLYHQGGLRSVMTGDLVQSVELLPGGYGPEWGRGLGAMLAVQTKRLRDAPDARDADGQLRLHGQASADPLEAAGRLSVPIGDALLTGAGRYSWLDKTLASVVGAQVQEVFPLPTYQDVQTRLEVPMPKGKSLDVTWLHSGDGVTRVQNREDPNSQVRDVKSQSFERVYVRYSQTLADGAELQVTPWWGLDAQAQSQQVGALGASAQQSGWSGGLRALWQKAMAPSVKLRAGLDLEASQTDATRAGSIGAPAREGDIRAFGQPPPEQVAADTWQVMQLGVAPWVSLATQWFGQRLEVEPGLRLDPLTRSVSRKLPQAGLAPMVGLYTNDFSMEPRVQARLRVVDALTLRASWALVAQPPAAADLSASFGNPSLAVAHGEHWVGAAQLSLPLGVTLEVAAFSMTSDSLTVRNPVDQPLLAQALVATGEGRSRGVQATVRATAGSWFGWVSYTLSRAERRSSPTADWRLSDYDQTHLLTAAIAFRPGAGFDLGARVRYATGAPRTPVIGSWYDALRNIWQPIFGAQNTDRLPDFFELDFSATKRWTWPRSWLEAYLEVLNATNRPNIEEFVYTADYSRRSGLRGLPLLPMAGLRCGW